MSLPNQVSVAKGKARLLGLHELEPVAEGVVHVDVVVALQGLSFDHGMAGMIEAGHEFPQLGNEQAWMRLPGGAEVGVDAEVHSRRAVFEPGSAPGDEVAGFGLSGRPNKPE